MVPAGQAGPCKRRQRQDCIAADRSVQDARQNADDEEHASRPVFGEPRAVRLQREVQSIGEVRYGAVESRQHDDLEYLVIAIVRAKIPELLVGERRAFVQGVHGGDQRGLRRCPMAGVRGHGQQLGNVGRGDPRLLRELRDVHAPFVLAAGPRAGSVNHDLPLAQAEEPAVQERSGPEL